MVGVAVNVVAVLPQIVVLAVAIATDGGVIGFTVTVTFTVLEQPVPAFVPVTL